MAGAYEHALLIGEVDPRHTGQRRAELGICKRRAAPKGGRHLLSDEVVHVAFLSGDGKRMRIFGVCDAAEQLDIVALEKLI